MVSLMAGMARFELTYAGVKVLCLNQLGDIPIYRIIISKREVFVNSFEENFVFPTKLEGK